ncbi:cysteine-rich CWC family protein [Propionivibrio limicola]|uniref:cysteine-rich CWC family protein n=1 Tax=Propionivibrio limicola TaxID=167645 RepID=UPI0024840925|nr:cysteine-rich CWC family protein [Propionivibrio limicola]
MKTSVCPACGAEFVCGVTAGQMVCWCMENAVRLPVTVLLGGVDGQNDESHLVACYCPACLARKTRETTGH